MDTKALWLTILVVLSLGLSMSAATAQTVTIANGSADAGATTTVTITADAVTDLANFDITVTYDSTVVNVTAADNGGFGNMNNLENAAAGTVNLLSFNTGGGQTGDDIVLSTLTLESVGTAGQTSALTLTINELLNSSEGIIDATTNDGVFTVAGVGTTGDIVINEFVSDNTTAEWVELYNNGTESVDLTGWTLEDGAGTTKSLSGTIPADGYLVFSYGSGWLNNGGDIIYLNNTTANIDKVVYGDWDDGNTEDNAPAPDAGESVGRFPNGVDTDVDVADFQIFDNPTQGAENVVTMAVDTTTPYTSEHDPESGATGVPIDTSITVHVLDDGTGVNISTIVMTVNGADVTLTPDDITGTPTEYTIVYTPPEDFDYDQLVNVTIDAADLNDTPNAMVPDEYSFTITGETPSGPTVSISNGSADAGATTTVTITADAVTDLANFHIIVTYDSTVVKVTAADNGGFGDMNNLENASTGTVRLVSFSTGGGQTGDDIVLSTLTLESVGTAGQTSALTLTINELLNSSEGIIDATTNDGVFTVTGETPSGPTVSISNGSADAGATTTVTITADAVTDLANFDITVTYDSTVVNVTAADNGGFGNMNNLENAATGAVRLVSFNTGGGQTGDGVLLSTLTLESVGTAGQTSALALTINELLNSSEGIIDATTNDGVFTVAEAPGATDDDDSSTGGGGGDGTYPPGWGEEAPAPAAATPAPAAAEPTVASTKAPTEAPTKAPTKAPTVAATKITTTEMKTEGTPGFGAVVTVFAIAGLLVAAYLVMRRRE